MILLFPIQIHMRITLMIILHLSNFISQRLLPLKKDILIFLLITALGLVKHALIWEIM